VGGGIHDRGEDHVCGGAGEGEERLELVWRLTYARGDEIRGIREQDGRVDVGVCIKQANPSYTTRGGACDIFFTRLSFL
jgi:hypothetical protein